MATSIKKNFVYKSILTVSTYILGFITFPYISRVFGVERFGLVNFAENSINYFLLFATMGISILGVREIAGVQANEYIRNKVFSNILGLNVLFTFIVLLIYFVIIILIPKFYNNPELFYIGAAKILATPFVIEWFYTGVEKFKFITIRSIIIKCLYAASVFIFVKDSDDYILYFVLTVGMIVANALINILYSRKYVQIIISELFNFRYFKSNITLGIYAIMTSMYLTFNVMYLGFVSDNIQVGYYTTAFKLYSVILGFFSAFTNIMMPRMSALISEGNNLRFQELIKKSFSIISCLSLPIIACGIITAPQVIYILSGKGYEGAILPMRIIMPAILFVGIAQVLAIQILMPMKADKTLTSISVLGAFVSIIFNVLLVKNLQSIGSSIVLLLCEFIVTLSYVIYILRRTEINLPWERLIQGLVLTVPCAIICQICVRYISSPYVCIAVIALIMSLLGICMLIYQSRIKGKA